MIDPERESALRRAIEELYFGYRAFTALPDRILARRGLGRTHQRILYFVCREPGLSVGELLATLRVTKQATNRPLRELQAAGLLAVSVDAEDRRVRRLSPTAAGHELEAQLSGAQMQLLESVFSESGERAEHGFLEVISRLHADGEQRPA